MRPIFRKLCAITRFSRNYAISHSLTIPEVLFRIRHAFRWDVLRARDKEEAHEAAAEGIL